MTHGDFAYDSNVTEQNCITYIEEKVKEHKKLYCLYDHDFLAIVHIIDTDGAFMNMNDIIEDASKQNNLFKDNKLLTNNRDTIIKRFDKKSRIYQKLNVVNEISNIKYYKFYFSRNLEHALYGLENVTAIEKKDLSNKFDLEHKGDAEKFKKQLKDIMFDIPNDYNKSWEYIFIENNSLKRCSNISILLDIVTRIIEENANDTRFV